MSVYTNEYILLMPDFFGFGRVDALPGKPSEHNRHNHSGLKHQNINWKIDEGVCKSIWNREIHFY